MSRHGIRIIKDQLDKMQLKLEPLDEKDRSILRASALPFCPLKRFYELATEEFDAAKFFTFDGKFFTGIGTQVHGHIQSWFVKFFGDAVTILGADENNELCEYTPAAAADYREISLKTDYLTGHVDGIYLVNETQECYVVDYKTCSTHLMTKYRKDPVGYTGIPKNNHKYQLRAYMHLLAPILADYDVTIESGLLIYVNRDMPSFEVIEVPPADYDMEEELRRMNAGWQRILEFDGSYNRETAEFCEAHAICESKEFYDREVHVKSSPCPLADVCFEREKLWAKLAELE